MFIKEFDFHSDNMDGYVYILSNKAMPGIYKIGCTSKNPDERAIELYTTGIPVHFVVEYSIYIKNYQYIERLIHKNLSKYNVNKEFFNCDLIKCILEIKKIANTKSPYKEKYYTEHLKARVEGWEDEYLQTKEKEKLKMKEIEDAKAQEELRKKIERKKNQKKENWEEIKVYLVLCVSFGIGLLLGHSMHSVLPVFICIMIGCLLYSAE